MQIVIQWYAIRLVQGQIQCRLVPASRLQSSRATFSEDQAAFVCSASPARLAVYVLESEKKYQQAFLSTHKGWQMIGVAHAVLYPGQQLHRLYRAQYAILLNAHLLRSSY